MNTHNSYPNLDTFELCKLEANDLSSAFKQTLLDLKTNRYFVCLTYEYRDGYPTLCCQYSDYTEWVPWEENRFLFIKTKSITSQK